MKALHLALGIALLHSCDSPETPASKSPDQPPAAQTPPAKENPPLVGNSWLAESIEKGGVIDNARTFIRFDSPEKVSGNGGINGFSGPCTLNGDKLTFGALRSTKMAGAPALMNQEQAFHQSLGKTRSYQFDGDGRLFLLDDAGKEVLQLIALDNE